MKHEGEKRIDSNSYQFGYISCQAIVLMEKSWAQDRTRIYCRKQRALASFADSNSLGQYSKKKCYDLPSCCRIVQGRSRNCSPFCSVHKGACPWASKQWHTHPPYVLSATPKLLFAEGPASGKDLGTCLGKWDLALAVGVLECPCQRECQNKCQIECQNRMSDRI